MRIRLSGIAKGRLLLPAIMVLAFTRGAAQQYDTAHHLNFPIELDSFVVRAGFDPRAFIRRVQNDTTFYKAFRSLHLVPFTSTDSYMAFGKNRQVTATNNCRSQQKIDARGCRVATLLSQQTTGDFFKRNGSHSYFTAQLFYDLFYSKTPVCNQDDIVAGVLKLVDNSRMEKSKYELKQLIFNPGSKVSGVPFMGDRASIFDESEVGKYDFKIKQEVYEGEESFVFSITPKPEYKNKVVYNELVTWFRKADYSILARDYSLSYSTLLYSFDVKMKVRVRQVGGKLYPVHIAYDGTWHVFTQKTERMKVVMDVAY
jgi:hypothetical protein